MPVDYKTLTSARFGRYYTALEPILAQPRVRAYTMAILSFFAMSFFGYFAIRPTLTIITNLRRQIADARFVDQKFQEKINALSKASVEYETIKPDLEIVFTALPRGTDFPRFVKSIEKVATESGTPIVSLSFRPIDLSPRENKETTGPTSEIPIGFNLIVGGDYLSLADFIYRLTSFERLITIERMAFSGGGEKKVSLSLIGQAYFAPAKQREKRADFAPAKQREKRADFAPASQTAYVQ